MTDAPDLAPVPLSGIAYEIRVCGGCRQWRWIRTGELECPACKGEVTG